MKDNDDDQTSHTTQDGDQHHITVRHSRVIYPSDSCDKVAMLDLKEKEFEQGKD